MSNHAVTLASAQGVKNQMQVETGVAEDVIPAAVSVETGQWTVYLEGPRSAKASVQTVPGHTLVHLDLPEGELGEYHICVQQAFTNIHRSWIGQVDCWRGRELTSIALNITFDTAVNKNIPVVCNYDLNGTSRGVVGLMDHQPMTTVNQRAVLDQPPMQWIRTRFTRSRKQGGFRETVVIGTQAVHFAQAISDHLRVCRDGQGISPLPAPDWAREPVWCSWYSHLYMLTQADVEAQIESCRELGIGTLVLDASWFKLPGVAYSHVWGDYQPEQQLMPDMLALSRKVHDAGLKLMLWCSPLYVGKKAAIRQAMSPYCALVNGVRETRLCPHCPEAITHARKLVQRVMGDYELDGLKLDFMDCTDDPPCIDPAHEHRQGNFGQAMAKLLGEVRDGILEVNPHAAMEYRIAYSNVATLGMANCHRGNDSPYDGDYIRRENLFLRMFCDHPSAVWSDYAYWHPDESPHNVGLILGQQIFSGGVPTLSVDMTTLRQCHRHTIEKWLAFYRAHAQRLAEATLRVHSSDSCLSVTSLEHAPSHTAYVLLAGQHVPAKLELSANTQRLWLLNASAEEQGSMSIAHGRHTSISLAGRELQAFDL